MKRKSLESPIWTGSSSGSVPATAGSHSLLVAALAGGIFLGLVSGGWIANSKGHVPEATPATLDTEQVSPNAFAASLARVRQKLIDTRKQLDQASSRAKKAGPD